MRITWMFVWFGLIQCILAHAAVRAPTEMAFAMRSWLLLLPSFSLCKEHTSALPLQAKPRLGYLTLQNLSISMSVETNLQLGMLLSTSLYCFGVILIDCFPTLVFE